MKKVLALVIVTVMGLSSTTFATDAVSTTQAPAATHSTAARTIHYKRHHKAVVRPAAKQEVQAAKKHRKAEVKPTVAQKAQVVKRHKKIEAKPAAPQKAQTAEKHRKVAAKPVTQKAQAAKKHHKTIKHQTAKPATQPVV